MDCRRCKFKTKCHESLVSHVTKRHRMCMKCGQTFLLQDDLLTHLQFTHGEHVKCSKCSFKAYPSFELQYHAMTVHGTCGKCVGDKDGHLEPDHQPRVVECTIWKRFKLDSEGESEDEPVVSIETLDSDNNVDDNQPMLSDSSPEKVTKAAANAIDIKQELLEDSRSIQRKRVVSEMEIQEVQRKRMTSQPEPPIQRTRNASDIENQDPKAKEAETSLDCKYCNKYFTYTAPNRKALINHLRQLHMKELAVEDPVVRDKLLAEKRPGPGDIPGFSSVRLVGDSPQKTSPYIPVSKKDLLLMPVTENPVVEKSVGSGSSKEDLTCKLCNKWFTFTAPNKAAMEEHYATIHKDEIKKKVLQVYKCIHCPKGKSFVHETSAGIKEHQKSFHSSIFIQDKFLQTAEIPTTLACGLCDDVGKFISARREDIRDHLKIIHGQDDDLFDQN